MSHVTEREDNRPHFRDKALDKSLGKFGPENLLKPYLKPISGTPEKGFRNGLNNFSSQNLPKPIQNPISKNPVEYPPCPLRGHLSVEGTENSVVRWHALQITHLIRNGLKLHEVPCRRVRLLGRVDRCVSNTRSHLGKMKGICRPHRGPLTPRGRPKPIFPTVLAQSGPKSDMSTRFARRRQKH